MRRGALSGHKLAPRVATVRPLQTTAQMAKCNQRVLGGSRLGYRCKMRLVARVPECNAPSRLSDKFGDILGKRRKEIDVPTHGNRTCGDNHVLAFNRLVVREGRPYTAGVAVNQPHGRAEYAAH